MMFKLSLLVALVAPFVSALQVNQPSQAVTSGGSMTFTWTVENGDPSSFDVLLSNPTFHDTFAVANNVDASKGTLTINIPLVPENQAYTIQLTAINDATKPLAESPSFTIGAASTSVSASTSAVLPTVTGATTRSATTTIPVPTETPLTSSAFGITVSNTQTASTAVTPAGSNTGAPATTTSNAAALPVRFDMNMGIITSMVLSVIAGVVVAL